MITEFSQRRGIVVSIWGKAYVRAANGPWRLLKLGDVVRPEDQLLTQQDSIVMMTDSHGQARPLALPAAGPATTATATETDRVIAALEANDRDAAPAAGAGVGEGGGLLPGLRVERIAEALAPVDLGTSLEALPLVFGRATASTAPDGTDGIDATALSASSSSITAVEEGIGQALGLASPRGTGPLQVLVTQVPGQGQVVTAAGTALAVGDTIPASALAGLRYLPPADYDGVSPVGGFAYSVSNGTATAVGSTQISLSAVNDAPLARAATLVSNEDALVAVSLGGSDVDGQVASVRITALPAQGSLLLADGVTPVASGAVLTAAQASTLLFRPAPDFHGTTALAFSVTDNNGVSSAAATLTIVVSPVADAPVATSDRASTVAGTTVTVAVLANDSDGDGDALRLDGASVDAALGTVGVNADGSLSFTAAAGVSGPVPIAYGISDGAGGSASATLTIDVTPATLSVDGPALSRDSTPQLTGTSNLPAGTTVTLSVTGSDGALQVVVAALGADGRYAVDVPLPLAEGPYSVGATVGATGATGALVSAVDGGTIDTLAPRLSVDAAALVNDSTPRISGNAGLPAGSTVGLTVTDALGAVQSFAATVQPDGSFGADVPAPLAQGAYSVVAAASDAAGNVASASSGGAVDTLRPTLRVDSLSLTNDSTPTISGTTDLPAGSTITLSVTDALGVVQTFTATVQAGGGFSAAVPAALAEGSYSVVASASDAAGNAAAANENGAIDTAAPTLTVDAPAITNDATPTITGTTDLPAGSTITLSVTDALGAVQTFTTTVQAGGSFSATVPAALAEGSFSVIAGATDVAGNAASANDGGALDTTAPMLSVDAPAITNDATPTITGTTDLPAGAIVTLTVTDALGAVQMFTTTVQAGGSFSATVPAALAQGSYMVAASANDTAGNAAAVNDSGAVDAAAPTLTVDAPVITNDATPTITGTTDLPAGSAITLTVTDALGTVQTFTATVQAGGGYSAAPPSALAEGSFSVTASARDAAGNAAAANGAGAVDTAAPTLTVDAPVITNDATPTITGTTDLPAGSTITVTVTDALGAVQTFTATVQAGGTFSAAVPSALADGSFSVIASASDAAGNATSANDSGAIDATAPTLTVDAPAVTNSATPTITGTTDLPAGSTITLSVTDALGAVQTFTTMVQAGGSFSAAVPAALAEGSFSVIASATDVAGNAAAANDSGAVDVTPPAASISLDLVTADNIVNAGEASGGITLTGSVGGDVQVGDSVTLIVNGSSHVGTVQAGNRFAIMVAGADLLADADRSVDASVSTRDAAGNTGGATATRTYAVNAAPVAVADTLALGEDSASVTGDATPATPEQDSDADGDALEVIGVAAGAQASAAGNVGSAITGAWGTLNLGADGSYRYTPLALAQTLSAGQTASDVFTYTIADGRGGFASATLTFSVSGAEDPTVIAGPLTGTAQEDVSASAVGTLGASDPETGARGFVVQTGVAGSYGLFSIDVAGQWSYTLGNAAAAVQALAAGQSASETFVVASDDGTTATVTVTVLGSNDAPVVASTAIAASEQGAAIALGLAAPSDVDNAALLTITVTGLPSLGQIRLADGTPVASGATLTAAQLTGLQYLPPADHDGIQPAGSFAYSVSDGIAAGVAGSTAIALAAVNDPPVAQNVSASGNEDAASIAVSLVASDVDGTIATYLVPSLPANGVLYSDAALTQAVVAGAPFASATLYFVPAPNFAGTVSFGYAASDGSLQSSAATVTLTVYPITDLSAADDAASGNEDNTITGSVAGNDSSTSGGGLSYAVASGVASGSLVFASNGSYLYTPNANFVGSDSFTYVVTDAVSGESLTRTVRLDVNAVADLSAADDSASGNEDTTITASVAANDATLSGGALSYALASGVSNGTLIFNSDGSYAYTPNLNFSGGDAFTYTVTDAASGESSSHSVAITVNPVADLNAVADSASGNEDSTINASVALNDSTTSGGTLSYALGALTVTHGTLVFNSDGSYRYTPDANYNGSDSFDYTVTDAVTGESSTRSVAITVNPVADLNAADDSLSGNRNSTFAASVAGNDSTSSGGTLGFALASGVANGSLVFNSNGSYTYTPRGGFTGTDSFSYAVSDAASGETRVQTVSITIHPKTDLSAADDSASTNEDTAITASVAGNDATTSGGTLSYALATGVANGTLIFNSSGGYTYTPNAHFNGTDSFSYTVTDTVTTGGQTQVTTLTQTVSITVNPVADLSATADAVGVNEDSAVTGSVAANDSTTSGGPLSYALATGVANGSLAFDGSGNFTYVPNANFSGSDGFTYTVTDAASGESSTQTVTITVNPLADLSAANDSASGNEDTVITASVAANDGTTSGGTLSYAVATGVTSGTLAFDANGSYRYTPNANFAGSDAFTYTVTDPASGESLTRTVSLSVNPVGDLSAADDAASGNEGAALAGSVAANDSTTSGGALSYAVVTGVSSGILAFANDGSYTYTPNANFTGVDSFTYSVTDAASGESLTRTVSLTINPLTDDLRAVDDAAAGNEDTAIVGSVAANDSTSSGGTLSFALATPVANGSLVFASNGSYTYTPAANFAGNDSFTYTVTDSATGEALTRTVNLTVNPVADLSAAPDAASGSEDTGPIAGSVAANDSTTSGGTLSYALATPVGNGSLVFASDGSYVYTPNANFAGNDSFTYTVTDAASGESSTQTVSIAVASVNDAPLASNAVAATGENAVLNGRVPPALDVDGTIAGYVLTAAPGAGNGSLSFNADGSYRFDPGSDFDSLAAGQSREVSFTYSAIDDWGAASAPATVTITVNGADDSAVVGTASINLAETDAVLTAGGTLAISDVDSAATFVAATITGSYGSLAIDAAGNWSYTASSAHNEFAAGTTYSDIFTVASADGTTSTVTVNILGSDDSAVISTATANLTETNAVITASGTLTISDVDSAATFVAATILGTHGSLAIDSVGNWSYTASSAHDGFAAGTTYSDTFTVVSADGTTTTVTVNILGSNDAAVISAATVNLTETNAALTASGTLTISDVDSAATFVAATITGSHGSLAIDSVGNWSYTASSAHDGFAAGTTYSDTFTVASTDGTTSTVTVNILGSNDAAVISTATANLTETNAVLTASGTLTIADVDSAATFVAATVAGTHGSLAIDATGNWSYTASSAHNEFAAGTTYSDTFTVASTDGTTSIVTVNILGTNDAALIAGATTAALTEAGGVANTAAGSPAASGTLTAADVDNAANAFQPVAAGATTASGYASYSVTPAGLWTVVLDNGHAAVQALNIGATLTDSFSVLSADGTPQTITVTINGANDAAVIAGTVSGAVVEAGGVANDAPGTPTVSGSVTAADVDDPANVFQVASAGTASDNGYGSYAMTADGTWTFTIDNSNATVQGLAAGTTLTETFTVRSADGTPQTITITIHGSNDAPVAQAASFTTAEDAALVNGSVVASDVDAGALLGYALNAAAPAGLVFNSDGSYTFNPAHPAYQSLAVGQSTVITVPYTVTDNAGASSSANLVITVTGSNDAPVADADSAAINEDGSLSISVASLLANDSDIDAGDTLSIVSVQGAVGGSVALVGGDVVFTPGTHYSGPASFTYTVTDGRGGSTVASVGINVSPVVDTPNLTVAANAAGLVFANSWEPAPNANTTSDALDLTTFDGWSRVDTPDPLAGGTNRFEVWTTGDTQTRQDGSTNVVVPSPGNGEDFLELNNASANVQTVGVSRSVATQAGMVYELSLDYAGRPGFGTDFTRIGIYLDGVLIQQYAATSPQAYLDWKNLKLSFAGDGGTHTLTIRTDATAFDANGRGAMIDDLRLIGFQGVVAGNAGANTSIALATYISASLQDLDGSESLAIAMSGLPTGARIVTAANPGGYLESGGSITFSGAELASAQLQISAGFTGRLSLGVTATATEASNAQTASTTATLELNVRPAMVATDLAGDGLANVLGTTANDTLSASNNADMIAARAGNDTIDARGGNDYVDGGDGNDSLLGGGGNDVLWGGSGSDSLTGGAGADVFAWTLGDRGAGGAATLPIDRIVDFASAAVAAGGDALDLRDLLIGETTSATLDRYLDFNVVGGSTEIRISSSGGFVGGTYVAGSEDQRIVLDAVDIRATLSLAATASDLQIITELINRGKLLTDVPAGG